jgi:crossover junction endodeoxyribonuclease RuvC
MRVLGVDPGLVRTGWAVVESREGDYRLLASGLIAPPPTLELAERLADGYGRFALVLDEFRPDVVVLEDIFSAPRHPTSALKMAHMRGVLCLAAGQRGVLVEPMTATTVKQRVTGNGHASKQQVQEMVLRLCQVGPRAMRADVSDAIALAVAGINQLERGLTRRGSPRSAMNRLLEAQSLDAARRHAGRGGAS